MIDYKQLASDLIAIQAEAVGRGTELLERAKMGEFDECGRGIDECGRKFETRKVKPEPPYDNSVHPIWETLRKTGEEQRAARDAELGRMVRSTVKACPKDTNLLTDNLYKAYAFDLIAKEAGK